MPRKTLEPTITRYSYPREIDNGAGERLIFVRRIPGALGDRLEVKNVVKTGLGPPMHVHFHQEEALTVEQGRIGYQRLGEQEQFAGPGETVTFEPGVAHKFWNAGEDDLKCSGYVEPVDSLEYFLTELFDSTKRHGGRPGLFDAAYLLRRYRSEFSMLEIPRVVQRFLFPVLIAAGELLGRHRKYANAPAPIRR